MGRSPVFATVSWTTRRPALASMSPSPSTYSPGIIGSDDGWSRAWCRRGMSPRPGPVPASPEPPLAAAAGHLGGDEDEKLVLFAWRQVHGPSLGGVPARLDRQVLSDGLVAQVGRGPARHDRSLAHDGVRVGHAPGELEILLHQQHRDPALLDPLDRLLDLQDDGGLYPLRGLIQEQEPGRGQQDAGDGELLLLAAREHPALPSEEGLELREEVEHLLELALRGGAARARRVGPPPHVADAQVLGDREIGEDLPPLWHVADASHDSLLGAPAAELHTAAGDASRPGG